MRRRVCQHARAKHSTNKRRSVLVRFFLHTLRGGRYSLARNRRAVGDSWEMKRRQEKDPDLFLAGDSLDCGLEVVDLFASTVTNSRGQDALSIGMVDFRL